MGDTPGLGGPPFVIADRVTGWVLWTVHPHLWMGVVLLVVGVGGVLWIRNWGD